MSCVCDCTMTCPLPSCIQQINIGATTLANGTEVYVYIRNEATGFTERLESTVTNGEINVGVFELPESFLNSHAFFTIWVTEQSNQAPVSITLGDATVDTCFTMRFEDAYQDNTKIPYNGIFADLVSA